MHVKAGRTFSVRAERKRVEKRVETEGEFGRIDCVMVARVVRRMRYEFPRARDAESASLRRRRLFICRNAERG